MQSFLVIVAMLAIMAVIVGGTWFWLAKAVKDKPDDLPVIGERPAEKRIAEKVG